MAARDGLPVVIETRDRTHSCASLVRVPLEDTPSEDWLQDVLDQSPQLLPITEIDERVEAPLVSLGRETPVPPAGAVDNLFLSRNGYLVVVETKLWRNPEARRQVVAQLIDYAAHIRSWRYENLQRIVQSRGRVHATLWELVNPEGFGEAAWIDRVNENLARGRMTLLVVGDGIRSETEALVATVGNQPEFPFRLALVELRLFRLTDHRYLLVPATIARTAEIERAIVRIEGGKASVETPVVAAGRASRRVLSEDALLDELRGRPDGVAAARAAQTLLRLLYPPLEAVWRSSSVTIKMPDPGGSGRMLSLCVVDDSGILYAYVSWLEKQLADLWKDSRAVEQIVDAQIRFLRKYGAKVSQTGKQHDVKLASLAGKEEEFVADLSKLAVLIEETATKQS